MIARLYDALPEDSKSGKNILTMPTEWGGFTHRYFKAPTNLQEQVAGRDAIAEWARITYGWLGRSPDYKAAFLGTLGANAEFYALLLPLRAGCTRSANTLLRHLRRADFLELVVWR